MSDGPRNVLCVLGSWRDLDEVSDLIEEIGPPGARLDREESVTHPLPVERDFDLAADRVRPSFTDEDQAAVRHHTAVAFVLGAPTRRHHAAQHATMMLRLVSALFGMGGATAVKCESSGISHGRARWLALARTVADGSERQRDSALVEAWVRKPLLDGRTYYSCGMHLLGHPDVEVGAGLPVDLAVSWIEAVGRRSLALEKGELTDGTELRVDGQSPMVARRSRTDRHPVDHIFHNPYGYWLLV